MLLFEHKQYLQSCGAEISMQTEISSFKILAVQCLQKRLVRDYNELLPGSDTSQTQINPAPRNTQQRGRGHARDEGKRKLGMYVKSYSYESRFCLLTILMDSQVSKSLKQQFLILLLCHPALHLSLSLSLSLSFRSSDKLQQTVPIIHLFSHSNEKHYKWTRVRLLCCIKALIRIKPYIKS